MDYIMSSPIRYPGGKKWLVPKILESILPHTTEMVSPFLGGGAIALNLALRRFKVYGYDISHHLVNFWQHWLRNPIFIEKRAKEILSIYPRDEIQELKRDCGCNGYEDAALYYTSNRVGFGGLSIDHSHIKHYEVIDAEYVYPLYQGQTTRRKVFPFSKLFQSLPQLDMSVEKSDFKHSLLVHDDVFAYMDPPYVDLEYLYRLDGFDHVGLAKILHNRDNWILSYNDTPFIRDLYSGYKTISMDGNNFTTGKKTSTELLIFSHDIACYIDSQPKQMSLDF